MVTVILLLALASSIYGVWRLFRRAPRQHHGWSSIWRLACLIAAIRITALWLGLAGLQRSDWLQIPAYFLLMLELPDIYIVKAARGEPLLWARLGSLTLAATSVGWSAAFLWLLNRFSSKPAGQAS